MAQACRRTEGRNEGSGEEKGGGACHGKLEYPVCGAGAGPKRGIGLAQLQHFGRLLHVRQGVTCLGSKAQGTPCGGT